MERITRGGMPLAKVEGNVRTVHPQVVPQHWEHGFQSYRGWQSIHLN